MMLWWHLWQLRSNVLRRRIQAAEKLGNYAVPQAIEALADVVRYGAYRNLDVVPLQVAACRSLGQIGSSPDAKGAATKIAAIKTAAIKALERALRASDSHLDVERAAAEGLSQTREPAAIAILQSCLEEHVALNIPQQDLIAAQLRTHVDQRSEPRLRAILELAAGNPVDAFRISPEVLPFITRALKRRFGAALPIIDALVEIRDSGAIIPLLQTSVQHPEWPVQQAAQAALVRLGTVAVEPLLETLSQPETTLATRCRAVDALGEIADDRALELIIPLLRGSADRPLREAAVAAVHKLKWSPANSAERAMLACAQEKWTDVVSEGDQATEILLEHLVYQQFSTPYYRPEVLNALRTIGDPSGLASALALLSRINSPERPSDTGRFPELEADIVRADATCVEPLIAIVVRRDYLSNELVAAELLGRIGDSRAAGPLVDMLGKVLDSDAPIVERALANLSGDETADALLNGLKSESYRARLVLAKLLGDKGGPRIVTGLLEILERGDPAVRAAAAQGLGRTADLTAIPALVRALGSSTDDVCCSAANALMGFRTLRAIAAIRTSLQPFEIISPILLNIRKYGWQVAEPLARAGDARIVAAVTDFMRQNDSHNYVSKSLEGLTELLWKAFPDTGRDALDALLNLPDSRRFQREETYWTTVGYGATDTLVSEKITELVDFTELKSSARQELAKR
jgi:HEAT repeat protein